MQTCSGVRKNNFASQIFAYNTVSGLVSTGRVQAAVIDCVTLGL